MLSRSALQPVDLGLILSYKCQAACAHCLYNCGPQWNDWMEPQDVFEALKQTLTWEAPYQVHLTGGEPFLNFPLLVQAVEFAVDLGIRCYIETNAGWCVNREITNERFATLYSAGLRAILISCSPFHAQTIPLERTLLALESGIETFGRQHTILYSPEWLDFLLQFNKEGDEIFW